METIIAIIIIFGLLISIHELGHLIFAKKAGILCPEFAVGFGPKLFSLKRGETVYTIRLLPIGGFVRMAGEEPEPIVVKPGHRVGLLFDKNKKVEKIILEQKVKFPQASVVTVDEADLEEDLYIRTAEDGGLPPETYEIRRDAEIFKGNQFVRIAPRDRQFGAKTVSQRFSAIIAGPLMNFLLAFVLFVLFAFMNGFPVDAPRLGEIIDNGAASEAGLQKGDRVLSVEGRPIGSWQELVRVIQKHPGETLVFKIERGGNIIRVQVTPEKREAANGQTEGFIGVYQPTETSVLGSIRFGAEQIYFWTKTIFIGVGKLITGEFGIDSLAGPVGIYSMTDRVAQNGLDNLVMWAAVLSLNVGIFNLLPLPALDGGRLVFLGFEAIRGKPVDPEKEALVHFIGFALLFILMIIVTWNDIHRFFLN